MQPTAQRPLQRSKAHNEDFRLNHLFSRNYQLYKGKQLQVTTTAWNLE